MTCSSQQRAGLAIIVQDVAFSCRGEISHIAFLNFGVKSRRQLGKRGRVGGGLGGGAHTHPTCTWARVHTHRCTAVHAKPCSHIRVQTHACKRLCANPRAAPCTPMRAPPHPPHPPPPRLLMPYSSSRSLAPVTMEQAGCAAAALL